MAEKWIPSGRWVRFILVIAVIFGVVLTLGGCQRGIKKDLLRRIPLITIVNGGVNLPPHLELDTVICVDGGTSRARCLLKDGRVLHCTDKNCGEIL